MKVEQVPGLVNDILKETSGEVDLLQEDLSNLVQTGDTIQNTCGVENFMRNLIDRIGRTRFDTRAYDIQTPSVLMDGWTYGSILRKIRTEIPDAVENESWELENGQSYDPFVVTTPKTHEKFYNGKSTFEVDRTWAERQVLSAFANPNEVMAFLADLENWVTVKFTISLDGLVMRTINNMIGETFYDLDSNGVYSGKTGVKAVNLLYLYNQTVPTPITLEEFMITPEAIRFSVNVFKNYIDRLKRASRLFNIGGTLKYTPESALNVIMHSQFKNAADVFLQSSTFHDQYTKLPGSESIVCWQGSGDTFDIADTSKISIKTKAGHEIEASGVLGVMFDREALGVCNKDLRTTSQWNGKGEYTNYFHKMDAMFINDFDQNFIVFYAA